MAISKITNVAIVGGGGNVGSYMLASLLDMKRFNVTVISRPDSKATFAKEVKVVRVDYENPETIVEALKGQDALIITMNVTAPPDTSDKLIHAAAKAGVPWVLPNEHGPYTTDEAQLVTMGPKLAAARKLIEDLGVSSWIAIATGFWYEHSLLGPGCFGFDAEKREVVFYDDGKEAMYTTTWPQVGRGMAALLALPVTSQGPDDKTPTLEKYRNRRAYISSFKLNQRDMFESIKRVTGTTDSDWKITSEPSKERFIDAKARVKKGDYSAFIIALYTRFFFPGEWENIHQGLDNDLLGLPTEDLDEATKASFKLVESGYWSGYGEFKKS